MKKLISSIVIMALAVTSIFQATSAAFEETVTVAGSSFTIGTSSGGGGGGGGGTGTNTALKFFVDLEGSAVDSNMSDTINGPVFDNIDSQWTDQMLVKMHNKGANAMNLISKANYVSDPDTLRDDIFVEVLAWNDANNNGVLDAGEEGQSYGHDSILRWRNDTFPLGQIAAAETRGFVLRFDGSGVTDANFGMEAVYDFVFTGVE